MEAAQLTRSQMVEEARILEALQQKQRQMRLSRLYSNMYDWQRRFNAATKDYTACALMAANQVGKTLTACIMDAYHLTGDYPDDWEGHTFRKPPLCWLLGYSMEKTRDLLQLKLFGRLTKSGFEGGLIPAERIVDYRSSSGTAGAVREVRVKHASGGTSTCQFWSYTQGQHALMGDVVDWYHIDEEPEDQEIYPQVMTRTINGDGGRGGRGILTFTPENGKTELVCSFMDDPGAGQYLQTATWDDAPHMDEDTKSRILAGYPAYQRDMRSRGVPLMGSGLIFEHPQEQITCKRFEIPDHWYLLNGMDFGWDHPQAHVQLAIDPDTASIYVTQAFKARKMQPYEAWHRVKAWAQGVPTAWPHDGNKMTHQMGHQDAVELKAMYEEEGWEMLSDHATWPDGGNGVWVGITKLNDLMGSGKFKVFDDLHEIIEEIREYHTKTNSAGVPQIVKVKDDLIDAVRYAFSMARHAEQKRDIMSPEPLYMDDVDVAENAFGY